jgi:hypothetical protein
MTKQYRKYIEKEREISKCLKYFDHLYAFCFGERQRT